MPRRFGPYTRPQSPHQPRAPPPEHLLRSQPRAAAEHVLPEPPCAPPHKHLLRSQVRGTVGTVRAELVDMLLGAPPPKHLLQSADEEEDDEEASEQEVAGQDVVVEEVSAQEVAGQLTKEEKDDLTFCKE